MTKLDQLRAAVRVSTRAPYTPDFEGGRARPSNVVATIGRSTRRRVRARVGAAAAWIDATHYLDSKGYTWTAQDLTAQGKGYLATSTAYGDPVTGLSKDSLPVLIEAYAATHSPTNPSATGATWGAMDYAKRAGVVIGPPLVGLLFGPAGAAVGAIVGASALGTLLVRDWV